MTYRTLTDVLLDRADSDSALYLVGGQGQRQRLPYTELLSRARRRLAQLQAAGLQPGSQLIIQTADTAQFLEGFWACLLGGITAVPVSGGSSAEHRFKLFRIAAKLVRPGLFTDGQTLTRLEEFSVRHALQDDFAALYQRTVACDETAPADGKGHVHAANENDTAFIQFSSGSTSTPKGVVLTHRNLVTNLRSIIDGCRMDDADHQFSWMPLTHDMGLIGFHLTPVYKDNDHSLMPTDVFVRRPVAWLTGVAEAGATILCSPNFGYQHLLKSFRPERHAGLDLSSVRLLFNGAEPISVSLCHRFMRTLQPLGLSARAMFPVYGLAEASLAVTFPSLEKPFTSLVVDRAHLAIGQSVNILAHHAGDFSASAPGSESAASSAQSSPGGVEFVSVGRPVDNVELQICDDSGSALPADTTGHICIRGPSVTTGYYREPELNEASISADGWLDTGDLGFVHDDQLLITGRAKDIIFVSGQNVYPHDLEEIVLQAGLVERGKLAISSQRMQDSGEEHLLVFLLHRSEPADLSETARAITRLLGESAGVAVHGIVPVPRIPKTTSGKVQRYLLVQSLEKGETQALIQNADPGEIVAQDDGDEAGQASDASRDSAPGDAVGQDTAERLLAICNEQVEGMQVSPDDNLFELGISSLTLAQIHAAIEDEWPDKVDITDLFDYPTVTALVRFLDERNAA